MKVFRTLLFAVATLAAVSGVVWYTMADWLPDDLMTQLPGSTREDVRRMLGPPTYFSGYPEGNPDEADAWEYARFGRVAMLQVRFSERGRVERVDHDR